MPLLINDELTISKENKKECENLQTYKAYLEKMWNPGLSEKDIQAYFHGLPSAMPKYLPDGHLDRSPRHSLSEQLQKKFNNVFENHFFHEPVTERDGKSIPRGLRTLFRQAYNHDKDGKIFGEENALISGILLDGTPGQITDLISMKLKDAQETVQRAADMSDKELVENFESIYDSCRIMGELDSIKDTQAAYMTPDLKKQISDLQKNTQSAGMAIDAKYRIMANPFYERTSVQMGDMYSVENCDLGKFMEAASSNPEFLQNPAFSEYTYQLENLKNQYRLEKRNALSDHIGNNYKENPSEIKIVGLPDGKSLGTGDKMDAEKMPLCYPVAAVSPDGTMHALYIHKHPDHQFSVSEEPIPEAFSRDDVRNLKDMEKELKNQDPLLLFTGSDEYKNVRETMHRITKGFPQNGNTLSEEDRRKLRNDMNDLAEVSKSYLDRKKGSTKPGLEQKRIQAVKRVADFAAARLALLDNLENQVMQNPDQMEEERRLNAEIADNKAKQQKADKPVSKDAEPKQHEEFAPRNEVVNSAMEYVDLQRTNHPSFVKGSKAERLFRETQRGLRKDMLDKLYGTKTYTPPQADAARHQMAQMVAVDMVLNDHLHNPVGGGPAEEFIEKNGFESFVDGIKNTNKFKELTANVTPQSYSRFLAEDQYRVFGNEIRTAALAERKAREAGDGKQAVHQNTFANSIEQSAKDAKKEAPVKKAPVKGM